MRLPSDSRERLAWLGLIAASFFARLIGLGERAMSHDESLHAIYSWYLSSNFNYQHDPMMHGPLLFHMNALVYLLFGANDFTARLVPALAGTGCVAMLWTFRRWLGRGGAFAAAVLVSVNPGLLYYSRYIRNDIYISLFTLAMVWALLRYRETRKPSCLYVLALALGLSFACKEVCFIHGAVLGSACVAFALLAAWKDRADGRFWDRLFQDPLMDCAVVLLSVSLPFASGLAHQLFEGWDPLDTRGAIGQRRTAAIALVLMASGFCVALTHFMQANRRRELPGFSVWAISLAVFWVPNLLLYSTLLTNLGQGLSSGVAGSLGYWLAQHDVKRGSPDPLFYLSLLLIYDPLLLFAGFRALARPGRPRVLPILAWWALGNFLVYSWAGERMPWLLVHISLPLCLIAGPVLAELWTRRGRMPVAVAFCAILGLHHAVNSLRANGPNAEMAFEPLVYAHAGPDVKIIADQILRHLDKHPEKWVQLKNDFAWPMAWYLRGRKASYAEVLDPVPDFAVAVVVSPEDRATLDGREWTPRGRAILIHWPLQEWHALSIANLRRLAEDRELWKTLLRFYFFRAAPGQDPDQWPLRNEILWFSREPAG